MDEKEQFRKKILTQLRSLRTDEIERRSIHVQKNIQKLPIYQRAKTVMAYYPLKGEPRILGMIRKDLSIKRFCFPAIDLRNKKLLPLCVRELENDFVRGPFGVMQPDEKTAQELHLEELDVVFVPGVAFDRTRLRLGRGGGYYDRLIAQLSPHTTTIGVAFDFQILDTLPVYAPHDEKTDFVVTDSECM